MAPYIRSPQTIPDDTPGGSTVRQGVADQNNIAIDDLFTNLNSHSNNEDGRTHIQIDESLNEIEANYLPIMNQAVVDAEAAATQAQNSEASASVYAQNAADCAQASIDTQDNYYNVFVEQANILGAVLPVVDGLPTGAIIESYSTTGGNGEIETVTKWADGTMIQTCTGNKGPVTLSPYTSEILRGSVPWFFQEDFVGEYCISGTAYQSALEGWVGGHSAGYPNYATFSYFTALIIGTAQDVFVDFTAIGRWF